LIVGAVAHPLPTPTGKHRNQQKKETTMSHLWTNFEFPAATRRLFKPAWRLSLIVGAALFVGAALAERFHSNPWLLTWIPATCCVTNDCCWEVTESELRPLSDDHWEVVSTGQVKKRTDWSPDGRFYRCACDYTEGHWVRHQGAVTRCVFVPLRSARAH
jgi:hypothetical protein